jgi:hypothetical protein
MTEKFAVVPPFGDVTLAMISWKAPATLQHTLASYESAGILGLFGARRIHFNAISAADEAVALRYGFTYSGTQANLGIFGAIDAMAASVTTPYVLSVENDCPLVTDRAGLLAMLGAALSDMAMMNVPVFTMRSRRQPGDEFSRRKRYEDRFRVVWPLGTDRSQCGAMTNLAVRLYEDARRSTLRGCSLYAEEDPTLRHPRIIKKSPHGNWLTNSRYLNWSNNCVLVRSDFLRDVVLDRVRNHPAPSTLNGHQDIEAALKVNGWWRKQHVAMGQSEPGPFTHQRIDR